jgi:hypothetical protein
VKTVAPAPLLSGSIALGRKRGNPRSDAHDFAVLATRHLIGGALRGAAIRAEDLASLTPRRPVPSESLHRTATPFIAIAIRWSLPMPLIPANRNADDAPEDRDPWIPDQVIDDAGRPDHNRKISD